MTLRFWQIDPTKPKHYCIVWNKPPHVKAHKTEYMCFNQTGKIPTLDGTSETGRQIHLPRKQCLINRKWHRHAANEGMDRYGGTKWWCWWWFLPFLLSPHLSLSARHIFQSQTAFIYQDISYHGHIILIFVSGSSIFTSVLTEGFSMKSAWQLRFCRERPALFKSGQWHFQRDNALLHNFILVTNFLTKMDIKTVPYPPYSPDLAPCDFWLFLNYFRTTDMWQMRIWKRIDTLTEEDFHCAFQELLEQYNKCIAAGGVYFEWD